MRHFGLAGLRKYLMHNVLEYLITHRLDTVARAAFSYDFDLLNDRPHHLADSLDGLTNNEHKRSSFYMRALFWIFPSILSIGKKGEMIRESKRQLGAVALQILRDAKAADDVRSAEKNLMSLMCTLFSFGLYFSNSLFLHSEGRTND
jgi:hypothetical protein